MDSIKINGYNLVNATPHKINLEIVTLEPREGLAKVLSAKPTENPAKIQDKQIEFVTVGFIPTEEGLKFLENTEEKTLYLGSIIAAQAYGFPVVAMVAMQGFERVPPAEKRMRSDKFTIFEK